jgi:hypothetical protein
MDTSGLSGHDRRVLADIEAMLREDRALDRALRTMEPRPRHRSSLLWQRLLRRPGRISAVAATMAVAILVAARTTHQLVLLGVAVGVWAVASVALFVWLGRSAGHDGAPRQGQGPQGGRRPPTLPPSAR